MWYSHAAYIYCVQYFIHAHPTTILLTARLSPIPHNRTNGHVSVQCAHFFNNAMWVSTIGVLRYPNPNGRDEWDDSRMSNGVCCVCYGRTELPDKAEWTKQTCSVVCGMRTDMVCYCMSAVYIWSTTCLSSILAGLMKLIVVYGCSVRMACNKKNWLLFFFGCVWQMHECMGLVWYGYGVLV